MSMNVPGQSQPEYLEPGSGPADSGEPPRSSRGRRTVLVAAAAVAVVAAVGVGAYGVVQLMSGGSSPATAVPADAVGYVSIDLDPSASQKIEAFKILRKSSPSKSARSRKCFGAFVIWALFQGCGRSFPACARPR